MKTRTKVAGKYQRRYSSGIQMYRERHNKVEIPANSTVNILRREPKKTLCSWKEFIVFIPSENLPKAHDEKGTKKARKHVNHVKATVAIETAVVAETAVATETAVAAEIAAAV